jgi:putative flippase GtrA
VKLITRWWRFNLVGVIGTGVQLGALAAMHRIIPSHYLLETAVAIEITLMHNFIWHMRYTWRMQRKNSEICAALGRFHVSNGLVSMLGNLVLMRVLVHGAGVPVVAANAVAIAACSVVNFTLGHTWAFRAGKVIPGSQLSVM